jgi:hypothetical protein
MWSHGSNEEKHLHWIIQPVSTETVQRHGGLHAEALQTAMFEADEYPDYDDVERFCTKVRRMFNAKP